MRYSWTTDRLTAAWVPKWYRCSFSNTVTDPLYFRMSCTGDACPQNEVDEVRWVPLAEARELLTHPRDRALLDSV